jgi:hypothetical protein
LHDIVTPEIDSGFGRLAAERIHANPLRYGVELPLLRLADMWLRPRVEMLNVPLRWWQYSKHRPETRFAFAYGALNLAYLLAALAGAFRWPWEDRWGDPHGFRQPEFSENAAAPGKPMLATALGAAMLTYVILRSLLLLTLEAPEPRYTLECFPVVIAFASVAVLAALPRKVAAPRDFSQLRESSRQH